MTKEEFIQGYCERSNITWEELSQFRKAIPCDCEDEGCHGWQMVALPECEFNDTFTSTTEGWKKE